MKNEMRALIAEDGRFVLTAMPKERHVDMAGRVWRLKGINLHWFGQYFMQPLFCISPVREVLSSIPIQLFDELHRKLHIVLTHKDKNTRK